MEGEGKNGGRQVLENERLQRERERETHPAPNSSDPSSWGATHMNKAVLGPPTPGSYPRQTQRQAVCNEPGSSCRIMDK